MGGRQLIALLAGGCLVNDSLYQQRLEETSDDDRDGFAEEDECDDEDASAFPGAEEVCDGVDQDCDGVVDDGAVDAVRWFRDADGDGHGLSSDYVVACDAPDGEHVATDGDCDDARADAYPGAAEVAYDRVDQDCDGGDLVDLDGDGHVGEEAAGEDCDDLDASINPSAADNPYDGIDQDCSGTDLVDVDGDGEDGTEAGGLDCDDGDEFVFSTAAEDWANGATDNDCDGERGDAVLEYGDLAWAGPVAGGQAGRRIAAPGDVDGDGLPDILVSAPYDGTRAEYAGAVMVLATDGPSALQTIARAEGRDTYSFLGSDIAGGDIDADGLADLLIPSTGAHSAAGETWLVPGTMVATTFDAEAVAMLSVIGDQEGSYSGGALSFFGDHDGDGITDIAIGSALHDGPDRPRAGAVAIVSGAERGSISFADSIVLTGPYADAGIGNRVISMGDLDRDGLADFALNFAFGDVASIVLGGCATAPLDDVERVRFTGTGDLASWDVWPAGDVDGDGAADLSIVIHDVDVLLFTDVLAAPSHGVLDWSHSIHTGQYLFQTGPLGDLDGDGTDELLAPTTLEASLLAPVAGVFFGDDLSFRSATSLLDAPLLAVSTRGGSSGCRFATPGDTDGDGVDELAMGAPSDGAGGADAGAVSLLPLPR